MNELGPLVDEFAKIPPWQGECPDGAFANFLGVMTDKEFIERHHPSNVVSAGGSLEIPPPTVTDGEPFFEYAAIRKAIDGAEGRFVMIELGGGYAARSVDAHRLLQQRNPMPSQLVIVEAEATHFQWIKRHLSANGINPAEHWLINAAVSTDSQPKLFMTGAGLFFNSFVASKDIDAIVEQIAEMDGANQVMRNLLVAGTCGMQIPYDSDAGTDLFDYAFVSAMPLADILAPLPHVDLMDIDIQGGEATVIEPAMDLLNAKVKRLHIGTHGDGIHAGLWDLFFEHEWVCEFDYGPNGQHETPWGRFKTTDGILHLVNPRLSNGDDE